VGVEPDHSAQITRIQKFGRSSDVIDRLSRTPVQDQNPEVTGKRRGFGRLENWRREWDSSAFAKATAGSHRVSHAIPPKLALNSLASGGGWIDVHLRASTFATARLRQTNRATVDTLRLRGDLSSLACHPKLAHDSGERRVAERVGFEPTVEFPLHTLSKRAPSTTRTSLRLFRIRGLRASGSAQKPKL